MPFHSLDDVHADYELLDADDRYRLLIDLGRDLEPMPDALKTDATLVRGCSAAVWVYPVPQGDGRLHFLADSNAAITKGIVALILLAVQDRTPARDPRARHRRRRSRRFDLTNQLSSNRTQGIPNMIALIRDTAGAAGGMSGPRTRRAASIPSASCPMSARSAMAARSASPISAMAPTGSSSRFAYDERLIGMPETGIIASGPIISLMDMATSLAIWVRLGRFRHQATLDLRVDYLRPAMPGRTIIGRGECYGATKSVGFVRGLAHDGDTDDPVANVTGTFMFTE